MQMPFVADPAKATTDLISKLRAELIAVRWHSRRTAVKSCEMKRSDMPRRCCRSRSRLEVQDVSVGFARDRGMREVLSGVSLAFQQRRHSLSPIGRIKEDPQAGSLLEQSEARLTALRGKELALAVSNPPAAQPDPCAPTAARFRG
jgi:hypothetical protein